MEFLPPALEPLSTWRQFVVYKITPSTERPGKTDKIPVDPLTGQRLAWTDASKLLDAATALKESVRLGNNYGTGFVITEHDPFWFLDIDECWDAANQQWSPIATQLFSRFPDAASEISSSGRGLHIIGSGTVPPHACKNKVNNIEFYSKGRFVALTGAQAQGLVTTDCTHLLPPLINEFFPAESSNVETQKFLNGPCAEWAGPTDDEELIKRALKSRSSRSIFGGGATFKDLWEANFPVLQKVYNSDVSSYDAALAQHLAFWTGKDENRMLGLMRQSALTRDKWEREAYLLTTISKACAKQVQVCQDKKKIAPAAQIYSPAVPSLETKPVAINSGYLTVEQQIELFSGCAYICDVHRILIPGGYLLKPEQFKVYAGGYSFPVDGRNERSTRNAWEAFTESQALRAPRADSTCFKPALQPGALIRHEGRTLANLWWPVETQREAGDITLFLNHLNKLIPNETDKIILLSYMAAVVQHKGVKFQWCPLIQGVEGNGKTLFSRAVEFAVGHRYTHFARAEGLASKFNDWMYAKIFIGVEDIYIQDSQIEVLEALKPMITRERQEIEPKGCAKITMDICCNFILNSNHKNAVRKTRNNRIFAPFYTAQQSKTDLVRDGLDNNYFFELYRWLETGGYARVSEYLHTFKIPPEYNPADRCLRAPQTSSTEAAISESLSGVEQEILEAIAQEKIGFRGGWISSVFLNNLLTENRVNRTIPYNKRRELLQLLGYDLHPGLNEGRVNNAISPDNHKSRLYVLKGHHTTHLTDAAEIARAYTAAQI